MAGPTAQPRHDAIKLPHSKHDRGILAAKSKEDQSHEEQGYSGEHTDEKASGAGEKGNGESVCPTVQVSSTDAPMTGQVLSADGGGSLGIGQEVGRPGKPSKKSNLRAHFE
jgi:hypothetical protein